MKQFEYKMEIYDSDCISKQWRKEIIDTLNKEGSDGWEIVSYDTLFDKREYTEVVYKRMKV